MKKETSDTFIVGVLALLLAGASAFLWAFGFDRFGYIAIGAAAVGTVTAIAGHIWQLRGPVGPRGPIGYTGADGQPGPTGPAGFIEED